MFQQPKGIKMKKTLLFVTLMMFSTSAYAEDSWKDNFPQQTWKQVETPPSKKKNNTKRSESKPQKQSQQKQSSYCMPNEIRAILDTVKTLFGSINIISAHRPGAKIAGTNKTSYHASCRAVDFIPPANKYNEVAAWLKANWKGGVGTYSCNMRHIHIDTGSTVRFHKCQ